MGSFLVRIGTTSAIASSGLAGSIEVPVSSTYKTSSTDIVDSGRGTDGVMSFNVIRQAIRKIEMSYRVISNADYVKLATFFNAHKTFYAYYYDTDDGAWETRNVYVGDRSVEAVKDKQLATTNIGGKLKPDYYENFKLSFIEV